MTGHFVAGAPCKKILLSMVEEDPGKNVSKSNKPSGNSQAFKQMTKEKRNAMASSELVLYR